MRKFLRRLLPGREAIRGNRWLRPFAKSLLHPRLWHLNRHSAAGAVAAGLFCGLIPGPFQMLGSALCALLFRVNLPLALLTTFYTNPLTIVPLYFMAYEIGRLASGEGAGFAAPPPFEWSGMMPWSRAMLAWAASLGRPLAIGIPLLAAGLAVIGYGAVRMAWRCHLMHARRRRTVPAERKARQ